MTKRILIAAGLVAALAGGGVIAAAQQPTPGPGIGGRAAGAKGLGGQRNGPRWGGPGGDLGLRGIELTEAQRAQVQSIMESHRAEFERLGTALREAHRAFNESLNAETIDETAVRSRSAVIASAMADQAILRARVRAELQNILTAEQQQQLSERRANLEKRAQQRQQQRPRRPGGGR